MIEIERQFLVPDPPDTAGAPFVAIEQGYILLRDRGRQQVRLRRAGSRFFQTIKSARGRVRYESEIELTQAQFDALWPLTEGRRLSKTRYTLIEDARPLSLDVYHGALDGVTVAEVEFECIEQRDAFEPPSWFGDEIEVADLHFEDGRPHVLFAHV